VHPSCSDIRLPFAGDAAAAASGGLHRHFLELLTGFSSDSYLPTLPPGAAASGAPPDLGALAQEAREGEAWALLFGSGAVAAAALASARGSVTALPAVMPKQEPSSSMVEPPAALAGRLLSLGQEVPAPVVQVGSASLPFCAAEFCCCWPAVAGLCALGEGQKS
jgi:hypothetical protein